ncbi:MAG: sulfotransferase family 2 domain-containing protein [Cyanobacteria bacterium P01_E01_bin.6]
MIISHRYKFIFIKTKKTAGTSLEVFLSQHCGDDDVFTPIFPPVDPHVARNYSGMWNPLPEIIQNRGREIRSSIRKVVHRKKFYNHMSAQDVQNRISQNTWKNYYKFSIERNPWEKVLSHYHMLNEREGNVLSLDEYLNRGSLNYCFNYPLYTNSKGDLLLEKIIRYESLNHDLGHVFQQLGIPFDGTLSVKAKSAHRKDRKPYQDVFTLQQKELIDAVFAKEIEMHGYTYQG